MCDSCACTHFSPHLWKAGECRDCHHPITSHAIVPTITTPEVVTRQVEIQPKNTHSFVGKLSHDKLEPFSRPEDQSLSGSGGTTRGGRNSTNLSTQYEPSPRLSINGRLQPIDEGPIPASRHRRTSSYNKPDGINNTMHRRTSSYGKPEGEGSPLAYEDRLSASYRKSREVQAKRKSISEAGGDHNEKEHHRSLIIEELVVTERDYCRDMDYLTQVIMDPLASKALLDKSDIAGIFSNIQEIRAVNSALLQQLEQSPNLSAQHVGEIFTKMSPFFKCYSKYCTNHINSLNILRSRKAERQELGLYLKSLKFNTNSGKLGVEDYLIKPIQRICKYPLFFHQLLEYTLPGGRDHASLTEANDQMQKVAAHVNEFHRDADSMNRVLEIQKDVHGLPFSLVASSRKFIFEQAATIKTLEEPHWSTRNLYLFSDILLYAKPPSKFSKKTTYVGSVELDHVVLSEKDNEVLVDKMDGTPVLKINCVSDVEKTQWTKHLSNVISDSSSRRMSLQQAMKETTNGQHESRTDVARRSSHRNSILDTDEIITKRSTLRHIDTIKRMYGKLTPADHEGNPLSVAGNVPPPQGHFETNGRPPASTPKKQPHTKPASSTNLKSSPQKHEAPPLQTLRAGPHASAPNLLVTHSSVSSAPSHSFPPNPSHTLPPPAYTTPYATAHQAPSNPAPSHPAPFHPAPPHPAPAHPTTSVPASHATPYSYPIHASTLPPHSFPPMPVSAHQPPPAYPIHGSTTTPHSFPPMPATHNSTTTTTSTTMSSMPPSLTPLPSFSSAPGFTSIPTFTPLPSFEQHLLPPSHTTFSPFSPVLTMDPTPSLIPMASYDESTEEDNYNNSNNNNNNNNIISSTELTTLSLRPQPPPRRARAETDPVNQQGQQRLRQLPETPNKSGYRMSMGSRVVTPS